MDWDKLRIFHMVAKAGSFTHAGATLNLSQSAVSRHISSFEEDLGLILFHRHARGLILTEQGELLYKATSEIFGRMVMIEGQLSDARDSGEGPLTLTLPEFMASAWLAPQLPQFHKSHPEINLTLLLDDRIFNLGMREADAAIRLHKPEQSDLIQRNLGKLPFSIFASKSYLKDFGTPENLKDLKDHTLIAYPDQSLVPYKNPNWLLEKADITLQKNKKLILINSLSTISSSVQSGLGIAALPKFMKSIHPDLVEILPDIKTESVDIHFVYPEERRHSKRITAFRDFIVASLEKNPM
ncbi:MAG: LysR family transcriptional regulator [Alphaproteobacteria bacterium]|mgnify:CR=1 FL=1|jgi:DNA-binding transcriptional LysR family regulator|nr:LysR family transcriptional regulator [Alphaproteobacteria bacterium]MCB1550505.1 LysR family transcriptional regulator [Alphaproteobacteria bacterium]MCB9985144.1 LysR family transcriptional regulator [Micavibrio sp.]HRK98041.1 LysR family transcriptional regulator [Alphaproteobacteria bacterium]